jgi:DNA repair exonuclease SbcCD ATPase subunit
MPHHHTDLPQPTDSRRRLLAADPYPPLAPPTLDDNSQADFEVPSSTWPADDELRREIARLETDPDVSGAGHDPFAPAAAAYATLDAHAGGAATATLSRPYTGPAADGYAGGDDLERLRAENEEMHKLIDEMKQIFEQASVQEEASSQELTRLRERAEELERQLPEKDEQVQLLTLQIQELEQHIQHAHVAPPSEDELSKLADELEQERCKLTQDRRALDQDRQQLREDEEALMKQMREMEVSMAKERAEMARQRTELQRLHGEVRHDLDQLQRGDGALKDRMAQFHRRHQEVFNRPTSAPAPAPAAAAAEEAPATRANGESGLIRRFFGRK